MFYLVYNQTMAVYFIYGEDDYNIDLKLSELRSKLNQDFLAINYKSLNNPDYETIINVLRATPMMFGSSLAIIDIAKYFFDDKYSFEEKELSEIENALNENQEGVDIAFVVRNSSYEGKKIDSRRKLFKILSKHNPIEYKLLPAYKTAEITAWIQHRAKDKKIKIDNDAIQVLIEQIGTNFLQLDNELDKLKLVAYPDNTITKKIAEENCTSNEDLFNITSYLMNGDKGKALFEFKMLLNRKHPLEILSALQTMIRQWVIVKAKANAPVQEIMNMTGIRYDFMVQNLKRDLKGIALKDLVKLKENLFDVESRIKMGQVIDIESEVEIALIK